MGKLKSDLFICLDCEATGLDIEKDEIVELAIVKFTMDQVLDSFETLIDPLIPMSPEVIEVHHITNEMVKGKPTIDQVLPKAFEMIGDLPIVGHNVGYDISMLIAASRRHKIPCPIDPAKTIDTVRLARLYAESPSNTLENLRIHFNIEEEGAHRAMNDVIVNIKVFKYLTKQFTKTEEILSRLKSPILLKTMPLGKHKGLLFREIPIDYLRWASKQDFDQDLLFTIENEKKRRKNRRPFSQSCNPFSDL